MLYVNVQCASLPAELRLVRYRIVSHIIDKKDWEQVKTFRLGLFTDALRIPALDPFDLLRVTSVTRVFSNPSLKWHRGSLAHLFQALDCQARGCQTRGCRSLDRGSCGLSGDPGCGCAFPASVFSSHRS